MSSFSSGWSIHMHVHLIDNAKGRAFNIESLNILVSHKYPSQQLYFIISIQTATILASLYTYHQSWQDIVCHITHLIHIKRDPQFLKAWYNSFGSSRCVHFTCLMGLQYLNTKKKNQPLALLHQYINLMKCKHPLICYAHFVYQQKYDKERTRV